MPLLKIDLKPGRTQFELVRALKLLRFRWEKRQFWVSIVVDEKQPLFRRQAAILQYFVRHSYGLSLAQILSDGLFDWVMVPSIIDQCFGNGPAALARHDITCVVFLLLPKMRMGDGYSVNLVVEPKLTVDEFRDILINCKNGEKYTICNVAGDQQLEGGHRIHWFRWRFLGKRFEMC